MKNNHTMFYLITILVLAAAFGCLYLHYANETKTNNKEVNQVDHTELFSRKVRMLEAQAWNSKMNSFYRMWSHYGIEYKVFPLDCGVGEYKYKEAFNEQCKRLEKEMIKKDED